MFKTPKGTELPLLNLKGKKYLVVAARLVWFREERPEWSITTEIIQTTDTHSIVKASILDTKNCYMIATAHKREDLKHFVDHLEKAETGAIGRALALCGYGTQFAPELDEGDRIVDSPVSFVKSPVKPAIKVNDSTFPSGIYKGKDIAGINPKTLVEYFFKINKLSSDGVKIDELDATISFMKSHLKSLDEQTKLSYLKEFGLDINSL